MCLFTTGGEVAKAELDFWSAGRSATSLGILGAGVATAGL